MYLEVRYSVNTHSLKHANITIYQRQRKREQGNPSLQVKNSSLNSHQSLNQNSRISFDVQRLNTPQINLYYSPKKDLTRNPPCGILWLMKKDKDIHIRISDDKLQALRKIAFFDKRSVVTLIDFAIIKFLHTRRKTLDRKIMEK